MKFPTEWKNEKWSKTTARQYTGGSPILGNHWVFHQKRWERCFSRWCLTSCTPSVIQFSRKNGAWKRFEFTSHVQAQSSHWHFLTPPNKNMLDWGKFHINGTIEWMCLARWMGFVRSILGANQWEIRGLSPRFHHAWLTYESIQVSLGWKDGQSAVEWFVCPRKIWWFHKSTLVHWNQLENNV